ncbi:Golgi phosphoprotein 3 family protein [Cavenderia fasciculata]|uniref:Golgi phosphoprotein 3 family protein n=1 Tax=Cavenderia fasciculata TaxID=261658 RepID=F4QBF8_CACFS|nr:Golgi phosphoprotein 3 family protein [Cavenderia fasciculata]EGG14930.1 Golgi phosphoprotein 3 family protein [Cavenderia fasciculata]|eukprot:XP_004351446.1 Golgi phosphoprotein 3 family protein [Cavenderia fasciculata]
MNESLLQPNHDDLFLDTSPKMESPKVQSFYQHNNNSNNKINQGQLDKNNLSLPEQLFLLMLQGQQRCRLPPSNVPFYLGFIGVALGDLLLRGRLAVEKGEVKNLILIKVVDITPTGDGVLDYILNKCDKFSSKRSKTFGGMIMSISRGFNYQVQRKITTKIGEQLVEKGILANGPDSFFAKTYLWRDMNQKRKLESTCSLLISPEFDIDNDSIFDESRIKEIILLLTMKQYTNTTRYSMVKEFMKRNFKDSDQKSAQDNIKHLEQTFKTINYSTPYHKMVYWILQGVRYSFDSNS